MALEWIGPISGLTLGLAGILATVWGTRTATRSTVEAAREARESAERIAREERNHQRLFADLDRLRSEYAEVMDLCNEYLFAIITAVPAPPMGTKDVQRLIMLDRTPQLARLVSRNGLGADPTVQQALGQLVTPALGAYEDDAKAFREAMGTVGGVMSAHLRALGLSLN